MLYNIQDKLKINLPTRHADKVDAYNEEWDKENGQGWELKNFIELTKELIRCWRQCRFFFVRILFE